jgi:uncharacterized membrane protein
METNKFILSDKQKKISWYNYMYLMNIIAESKSSGTELPHFKTDK